MSKCSKRMLCKGCNSEYPPSLFQAHIRICRQLQRGGLKVEIEETKVEEDKIIRIAVEEGGRRWSVQKEWDECCALHKELLRTFPMFQMPRVTDSLFGEVANTHTLTDTSFQANLKAYFRVFIYIYIYIYVRKLFSMNYSLIMIY